MTTATRMSRFSVMCYDAPMLVMAAILLLALVALEAGSGLLALLLLCAAAGWWALCCLRLAAGVAEGLKAWWRAP